MENPAVKVVEVTNHEPLTVLAQDVKLGNADIEANLNRLLAMYRDRAKKVFLLKWEGNKIPRGAIVLEHEIAWTQNGMVTATSGQMIGTYQRLVEFGGETGKEQLMLVFVI